MRFRSSILALLLASCGAAESATQSQPATVSEVIEVSGSVGVDDCTRRAACPMPGSLCLDTDDAVPDLYVCIAPGAPGAATWEQIAFVSAMSLLHRILSDRNIDASSHPGLYPLVYAEPNDPNASGKLCPDRGGRGRGDNDVSLFVNSETKELFYCQGGPSESWHRVLTAEALADTTLAPGPSFHFSVRDGKAVVGRCLRSAIRGNGSGLAACSAAEAASASYPFAESLWIERVDCVQGRTGGWETGDWLRLAVRQRTAGDGAIEDLAPGAGQVLFDVNGAGPEEGRVFSGGVASWTSGSGALYLEVVARNDPRDNMEIDLLCTVHTRRRM